MAKFKKRKKNLGFSLIELMAAIGISSLVAYLLFLGIRYGANNIRTTSVKMQMEESARRGLALMAEELRQTTPTGSNILQGAGVNGTDVIAFQLPDPVNPSNLTTGQINWAATQFQYLVGGLDNRQLLRTAAGVVTDVLANDVTDFDLIDGPACTAIQPNPNCDAGDSTILTMTVWVQRTLSNGRTIPVAPLPVRARADMQSD